MRKFHQFHIVSASPWPIVASIQMGSIIIIISSLFNFTGKSTIITMCTINIIIISFYWWNRTASEASKEGLHQERVINGLKIGMIFFITSEVIFFISFFWAYFHSRISPNMEIGQEWPPNIIRRFNPRNIPLLNTLILLSSGVSVTWAHNSIVKRRKKALVYSMVLTCSLGMYFSFLQYIEYKIGEFTIADASYGSIFFLGTGFHGIHVLIGTIFLSVSLYIILKEKVSKKHHISFEMAAWYWHFVDVVWLFLYLSIYWWGK